MYEVDNIKKLLREYREGKVSDEELVSALTSLLLVKNLNTVRLDVNRDLRVGFPEIIYGPGKKYDDIRNSALAMLQFRGKVFIYGLAGEYKSKLINDLGLDLNKYIIKEANNLLLIKDKGLLNNNEREKIGRVALLTGGTVDVPYAEETALILEELGVEVFKYYDVGVANLNRVLEALSDAIKHGIDLIIVFAGMDGVLPVVTASIVPIPVIGVPISSGYGFGGNGNAALMTMLQSCVPGLVVVNINNTVGAAAAAYRILLTINKRLTNMMSNEQVKIYE